MESCSECYPLVLNACSETLTIPIGSGVEGNIVYWRITDKFNHIYEGTAILDADLNIQIEVDDFPSGLFGPFSGSFTFQVAAIVDASAPAPTYVCEWTDVVVCDEPYSCISMKFVMRTNVDDIDVGTGGAYNANGYQEVVVTTNQALGDESGLHNTK